MNVKVKFNTDIYAKFSQQYPDIKNPNRIVEKYANQLQREIWSSIQYGNYDSVANTYQISLESLRRKGGRYTIKNTNGEELKPYFGQWIKTHYPLFDIVELGTKANGKTSTVRFNGNITIIDITAKPLNALQQSTMAELKNNTDIEDVMPLEQWQDLLDANNTSRLFEELYPEFDPATMEYSKFMEYGNHSELFHILPVDHQSLEAAIHFLKSSKCTLKYTKKQSAIIQLSVILQVTSLTKVSTGLGQYARYANYYQRISPSPFGRTYYKGVSIQSIPSSMRRAVVGNAYSYDFKSCAISYRMCFAKLYLKHIDKPDGKISEEMSATHMYLTDKKRFLETIKKDVFAPTWGRGYTFENLQDGLLKQAFLALGFGAKSNPDIRYKSNGEWHYGTINELFKNAEERARFNANPLVIKFKAEQKIFEKVISECILGKNPELNAKGSCIRDNNGQGRKNSGKVVSWGYQQFETALMNTFLEITNDRTWHPGANYKVIGRIHDGIILNQCITEYYLVQIMKKLRAKFNNPYIDIKAEPKLERYAPLIPESTILEGIAHQERMREEEKRAVEYAKLKAERGIKTLVNIDVDEIPEPLNNAAMLAEWGFTEDDSVTNRPMPKKLEMMFLKSMAKEIEEREADRRLQPKVTKEEILRKIAHTTPIVKDEEDECGAEIDITAAILNNPPEDINDCTSNSYKAFMLAKLRKMAADKGYTPYKPSGYAG